ncbi:MAG: GIY-YIG nuclease family protein [Clostridiales Family XIII bacterium]|jgi:hypothetical protein|nr:GIY-YIG nuclease family protein [Clostridiales Family XIII bacterium]
MKDAKTKKELQEQYKERKIIGGVYAIKNIRKDKLLLDASADLRGSNNRFDFAKKTGSCVNVKLQSDWNKQGSDDFAFEVMEELEKGETQTDAEFKADIDVLKEMWLEKLSGRDLY